jgi:cyclase
MTKLLLVGSLGLAALSTALFGFQATAQPAPKVIEVQKIRDNFYLLTGGGGNTSVFIAQDGVVVVDAKNPGWGSLLVEKIKSITDKPIKTVILTHSHSDHVGGLPEFPKGIQIVAHENAKANMLKTSLYGAGELFQKPENAQFLPNQTFQKKLTLFSGPDQVDLYYFGPGETGDDIWVVFPSLRIAVAGDNFSRKEVNLIDESAGGTGALAQTLRSAVNTIQNVDTVVPGH